MSFSGQVKEELSRHINTSRHCQIAEIAAVLSFAGKLEGAGEEKVLRVYTENLSLARKYCILTIMSMTIITLWHWSVR